MNNFAAGSSPHGKSRPGGAQRAAYINRFWAQTSSLLPSWADYRGIRRTWRADVMAGLTVGVVALPLALGFGISSGVGASAGLVTAIIAGLIAAIFGGSHVQISGPTGAMVVVLAPIVAVYGVGAVALVSVMAGIIVLLAGIFRLGRTVAYIPWPVIEGFTVGIGVIIFLQQVPSVTGQEPTHTNVLVSAYRALQTVPMTDLLWGIGAALLVAACMIILPRLHTGIPASLVGIIVVTGLAMVVANPLAVIGELPNAVPTLQLPSFSFSMAQALILPAFTVAALAGIESLLSVRVAASLGDAGPYDPDRELVGQGLASIGAGFFGGMPATGAIARTAVNLRAGGRTRVASSAHSVVLLLIVLVAAAPVGAVPLAALGGVLMVTASRMINLQAARAILRSTKADALAYIVTAIITISVDLIVAVVIGVVLAAFFALRALSRATGVSRGRIEGEPALGDERIALIRVRGPLFFATAERVLEEVTKVDNVSVVILQMSQLSSVDATGAHTLAEIVLRLERRGITALIKGVRQAHIELFANTGVLDSVRHHKHVFVNEEDAIVHARSHIARENGR